MALAVEPLLASLADRQRQRGKSRSGLTRIGALALRHGDHRFEWTRAEFREWVDGMASRFGYRAEIKGIGEEDESLGSPTQMAVFRRVEGSP